MPGRSISERRGQIGYLQLHLRLSSSHSVRIHPRLYRVRWTCRRPNRPASVGHRAPALSFSFPWIRASYLPCALCGSIKDVKVWRSSKCLCDPRTACTDHRTNVNRSPTKSLRLTIGFSVDVHFVVSTQCAVFFGPLHDEHGYFRFHDHVFRLPAFALEDFVWVIVKDDVPESSKECTPGLFLKGLSILASSSNRSCARS